MLTVEVQRQWGFQASCLFSPTLRFQRKSHHYYQVMDPASLNPPTPAGTNWVPTAILTRSTFAESEDFDAVTQSLLELDDYQHGVKQGPFGRTGWLEELFEWCKAAVAPLDLVLTGAFRQLNASPTFSLIRMETTRSAVWFKAVGEPNLKEFPISVALTRMFPSYVPAIIATRREWNGWLTQEVDGTSPSEASDWASWQQAAESLASLQISSCNRTSPLLHAGCKNLTVPVLVNLVDPFLEVIEDLMWLQTKNPPPSLSRLELRALGVILKAALSRLVQIGLPDTLGHLDFNPGNILVSGKRCVFLDWAEAYVGPPFLTFQHLLEHARKTLTASRSAESALIADYMRPWHSLISPESFSEALRLSPLTAVFAYAVGTNVWREEQTRNDSHVAGYLRSLVRRMKREADAIAMRRPICVTC